MGASTSWKPQGLSRALVGLLYLYIHIYIYIHTQRGADEPNQEGNKLGSMSGDARDFNNIETRAVIKFFPPAKQDA